MLNNHENDKLQVRIVIFDQLVCKVAFLYLLNKDFESFQVHLSFAFPAVLVLKILAFTDLNVDALDSHEMQTDFDKVKFVGFAFINVKLQGFDKL